jgi:hypothetical protein
MVPEATVLLDSHVSTTQYLVVDISCLIVMLAINGFLELFSLFHYC